MRFLHVIQRFPPAIGGSERWASDLCRALRTHGHHNTVMTIAVDHEEEYWAPPTNNSRRRSLGALEFGRDATVVRFAPSRLKSKALRRIALSLFHRRLGLYAIGPHSTQLYRAVLRGASCVDALMLHTLPYPHNWIGWVAGLASRRPIFLAPHFHVGHVDYETRANAFLLRHCDGVFVVTMAEMRHLVALGVSRDRLIYAPNGLWEVGELNRRVVESGAPPGSDCKVLFVGRQAEYKGIDNLIAACVLLRSSGANINLSLVGPQSDWSRACIARLAPVTSSWLRDLGEVSEERRDREMETAAVLVLPSRHEAFGIVLLEAWRAGTAVVCLDSEVSEEVVGSAGVRARSGEASDLAVAIDQVLSDAGGRAELIRRGRERLSKEFNWERRASECERLVRSVVRRRSNLRIMVVTNAFLPEFIGGAEIAAEALLREWRLRGVSVSLFVGAPSPFAKTIRATEKRYEGVPAVAVRYPLSRLAGDQEGFVSETVESLFAHTLAAFRPTIVHFHNLAGLSVRLPRIARSIGARTVQTLHDYGAFCARNTLLHRSGAMCGDTSRCAGCAPAIQTESEGAVPAVFRRHLYEHFARDVDLFLAPSQYALAQFKDAWRSIVRIEHFSNGYPSATTYEGADMRDERLSVFVGYLGAHKGADLVVKAFQEVVRVIPSARLEIAGDGEERMSLERQVQALGLVGAVSFRGSLPRAAVAALWRRAGTLVVGSKWPENAPVSIAEAMSAGTIVIAPRCGGIPEMVADKRTGMLYEAENIEHLTSVWLSTLGDRGQREAVAIGAQRQAATESYSVQADALLRRFAELEDTPRASDSKMDSRSGMVLAGCADQLMQGEGSAAMLDLIFRERQAVRAEWLFDEDLQGRKIAVLGSSDYAGRAVVRLLAAGLPILAPRGWRHAKTLAEAGCLLEYGTVDGLAAALQLLDEDPALIDAMRANALFALRQPCVLKTLADGY